MLQMMESGHGTAQGIPQLIMAGASADDVYVIILFTSLLGLAQSGRFAVTDLLRIPTSMILGLIGGILCGFLLTAFFQRFLGISLQYRRHEVAVRLSSKYSKLWVAAELLLFVLVGAAVDIPYAAQVGTKAVILLLGVLLFRMFGVWLSMLGTHFTGRERLFCMLAYTPKATVQAAIGSLPLSAGLACGNVVLSVAVVAILLTAPLGALLIDLAQPLTAPQGQKE